ncbi:hypothetical protein HK405_005780, partial [Cladochytrium tenue]
LLDGGRVEFIGATDSAAPCAMLVDLATTLAPKLSRTPGATTEVSPELIFFDGEEAFGDWTDDNSLSGSRHRQNGGPRNLGSGLWRMILLRSYLDRKVSQTLESSAAPRTKRPGRQTGRPVDWPESTRSSFSIF